MRTLSLVFAAVASLCVVAASSPAEAKRKQVRYAGIHSVPKGHGGGLCHIELPHVHVYAPDVAVQYREHDGQQVFVGDPVAYGWEGDRHSYYGHHPIHVNVLVGTEALDEEYCYLDGPHFHAFAPPPAVVTDFRVEGGAYFYVGTPPPAYVEARPAMVKINTVYQPLVYTRPVVTVAPPQGWIGVRFAGRPAHVRGGAVVEVHAPVVEIRPPTVEIGIGVGVGIGVGGAVIQRPHRHKHKKHKKHRGRR